MLWHVEERGRHYAGMLGIESGHNAVVYREEASIMLWCRGKRQVLCCDVGNREGYYAVV